MIKYLLVLCFVFVQTLFATPFLIGIAGGSGSGKTTLAKKIQKAIPAHSVIISQDAYYKDNPHLSFSEKATTNFDHPDSLEFSLLKTQLLTLKADRSIEQPVYNFSTHSREKKSIKVDPAPVIIIEGILLLAVPEIRELLDLKIFVDADNDVRVLRRIERDINERGRDFVGVKQQYLATVKPMHDLFVESSKQYADVIVPSNSSNEAAFDLILSKLKNEVSEKRYGG